MARNPDSLTKHLIPEDNDKLDLGNANQVFRTIFVNGLQSTSGLAITGQLLLPDGTATAPAQGHGNDPDTGFWRSASGNIRFTSDGTDALLFGGGGLQFPSP